ncbi:hypothetical protein [Mesorhizobium sp. L-8-3]|uniref:hypothetical protein n=1 Tax=Mesorhizobium sp. L-8-3 TaxID=2744522 RepID=UPI00192899A9|nr:hypothetical protein [Mesorhizobium sp. L-8-3]
MLKETTQQSEEVMMDDKCPLPAEICDEAAPRRVATTWEAIEWMARLNPPNSGPKIRHAHLSRRARRPVGRALQAMRDAVGELGHTRRPA